MIKYRHTGLILTYGLSHEVMNNISSFWMTNYEECPLIWLISSGQMCECLIRHFWWQTRMVICPASYLDLHRSSSKSASSRLASKCLIDTVSVCLHGRMAGRTSIQRLSGGEMKRRRFLWLKLCWKLQGRTFVLREKISAPSTKG